MVVLGLVDLLFCVVVNLFLPGILAGIALMVLGLGISQVLRVVR